MEAAHLYRHLHEAFGDTVFIDHECLRAGECWRGRIDDVIEAASAVVVVISAGWLEEIEQRQQDAAGDEVIRELTIALDARKTLIPLYVESAATATSSVAQRFALGSAPRRVIQALADTHALRWRARSLEEDLTVLTQTLASHLPRFGERLVRRCQQRLALQMDADKSSEPWRSKFKGLDQAMRRSAFEQQLAAALNGTDPILVVHAEEGMGKTIALGWSMQICADQPVLLADASDAAWRSGFAAGVEVLLRAGVPTSDRQQAGKLARLISGSEVELALAQPLLIAIDGLNEPEASDLIHWRILLSEASSLIERERPWRVLVTVRTDPWKHQIDSGRLHPSPRTLEIPAWSNAECRALATQIGFPWDQLDSQVSQQLRKPRMLIAASRVAPDILRGWEFTYGLILLLDLQQRAQTQHQRLSFENYCEVLRDFGRRMWTGAPVTRAGLSEQLSALNDSDLTREIEALCDHGLIRREGAKLTVDERAAGVAIGLALLAHLREAGTRDFATLRERIAAFITDGQDNTTAHALGHALVAGLFARVVAAEGKATADPVLAALFAEWDRRYNGGTGPRRLIWWLLPELTWLAENGNLGDAADWLARALQAEPTALDRNEHPIQRSFLRRIDDHWFTAVDLADESFTGRKDPARVAQREQRFKHARTVSSKLRIVPSKEIDLRRLALDVALRVALDPRTIDLNALIVSVALQPANAWDQLRQWVRRRADDWWSLLEPIWQQLTQADLGEDLRQKIAQLLYAMWPTRACKRCVAPPQRECDPPEYPEPVDYRLLVDATDLSDPNAIERLHRGVATSGLHADDSELAALALWSPDRLSQCIANLVDYATDATKPLQFFGTKLASLAPLLSHEHARRLRVRVTEGADLDSNQRGYLSLASWWRLPEARRTAAVLRHLQACDLSWEKLQCAQTSSAGAPQLIRRIARQPESVTAGRIAFWLYWTLDDSNALAVREALAKVLSTLRGESLSAATEFWILRLAHSLGLADAAAHLIAADWRYAPDADSYIQTNRVRSAVLAASGSLSPEELHSRCHPGHWDHAPEPFRSEFVTERVERLTTELLSDRPLIKQFLADPSGHDLQEACKHKPAWIAEILDSPKSTRFRLATSVADAIEPHETPGWLELLRVAVSRQDSIRTLLDGIDRRYLIAFKTPDSPAVRELWNSLRDEVEDDSELLQLVVAAVRGQGVEWLKSCSRMDSDALPHQQLRAATIAAMIDLSSEHAAISAASENHGGWIAEAFARVLKLYQSNQLAQAWYRRFRQATEWTEAWGSWHMHKEWVDLRQRVWKSADRPEHALTDGHRFERILAAGLKHAVERRNSALKKTRFSVPLI